MKTKKGSKFNSTNSFLKKVNKYTINKRRKEVKI